MEELDAIIIGGGACGLMCAVQAGFLGKKVVVLEKNEQAGAKILISGGGRCNYTNLNNGPENFLSANPHFSKSAFSQWTVEDTLTFFSTYGIEGQEKTLGQLFPVSNKASDIVNIFTGLCQEMDQQILLEAEVTAVNKGDDGVYEVLYTRKNKDQRLKARNVVIAAGGLPIKKMGATDFGLKIARQFGLDLAETAPALVPLTITGKDEEWYTLLSGTTVFARVSNDFVSFDENILFTHWGLSGPAILQISSYWRPGEKISINLLPGDSISERIRIEKNKNGKRLLLHLLAECFTRKFAEALGKYLPTETNIASLTNDDMDIIESFIHDFTLKPAGDKGYDKAEVMRGGVSTDELSSKTLEAKKVPGLFFGGECVDVTGWLGGYNFQWAWASGYVIAQHI